MDQLSLLKILMHYILVDLIFYLTILNAYYNAYVFIVTDFLAQ